MHRQFACFKINSYNDKIFPGKIAIKLRRIKLFARKICPKSTKTKQSPNTVK